MSLPKWNDPRFSKWDLCYQTSNTNFQVPVVSLALSGGNSLDVVSGLKSIVDDNNAMIAVCVTVMDSGAGLSIIGQNFMTNYSITYNRAKMTIGWTPSDCSTDLTLSNSTPGSVPAALPPTAPLPAVPRPASPNSTVTANSNVATAVLADILPLLLACLISLAAIFG